MPARRRRSRYLGRVLTERCRRVLTTARLAALPPSLGRRRELEALAYAVALDGGRRDAPGRDTYLRALSWNLSRLADLDWLLGAARAAGLRLVPFKGALLCRTHYGDPGARPMADVDVAVAPDELERAIALLCDAGFARLDPPAYRRARGGVHDVKLMRGAVTIELHHRLWHELRVASDVTPLVARAVEVPFGGATAWAPTEADHLYVVLVHAATHGFCGNVLWLADAALLAGGDDPSLWPRVEALAAASGARVAVAAARDQLAAAMPWLGARGDGVAPLRRALVRRLGPWLWRAGEQHGPWPSRLVRPLLFDRARDLGGWALEKLSNLRQGRAAGRYS